MKSFADIALTVDICAPTNHAHCLSVAREIAKLQAVANKMKDAPWKKFKDGFRNEEEKIKQYYDEYLPKLLEIDASEFFT